MTSVTVTKIKGIFMTFSTQVLHVNVVILPFLYPMTNVHLCRVVDRRAKGSALCSKCFGIQVDDIWMKLEGTERQTRLPLRNRERVGV